LAVRLLEYYKHDIEQLQLVPSGGSRFEVTVSGTLVFSKLAEDRFPDFGAIKEALKAILVG